jgi:hypothetical protein
MYIPKFFKNIHVFVIEDCCPSGGLLSKHPIHVFILQLEIFFFIP